MRVYVEELPDGCYRCVCNDDNWICNINGESISHDGRREDCPLKEIVHCQDCKYNYNNKWCELHKIPNRIEAEDYCSKGEKQVTGKLNNPNDSLLAEDSEGIKIQESKLDCISRQQAAEAFCDDCRGLKPGQCEHLDKCKSQKVLRLLPPVAPAERKGEWKIWNEPGNKCVYCTKCKHEYDQIDLYIGGSEYPNYCPNCGARMVGEPE